MELKETWKEHPLYKLGKIELIPTEWVYQYRGPDVSPFPDLLDGTVVTKEVLWNNILEIGMREPFIMRIGLANKKFRLESGNHRIVLFKEHGVPYVPVTVQVCKECGPEAPDLMTDATHNFDAPLGFLISKITDEYMAPSEVFAEFK